MLSDSNDVARREIISFSITCWTSVDPGSMPATALRTSDSNLASPGAVGSIRNLLKKAASAARSSPNPAYARRFRASRVSSGVASSEASTSTARTTESLTGRLVTNSNDTFCSAPGNSSLIRRNFLPNPRTVFSNPEAVHFRSVW